MQVDPHDCADIVVVRGRGAIAVSGVVFEGSGSAGGTGGAVLGERTRDTRAAAAHGATVVYPGVVTSNTG